eukprot:jgi/Tetstr1/422088/TSEL_012947.t1
MRAYMGAAGVQEAGCVVLDSMTRGAEASREPAGRLGVLADIQRAMRRHVGNVRVQRVACKALFSLTHKATASRIEAGRLGLLEDLRSVMATASEPTAAHVQRLSA